MPQHKHNAAKDHRHQLTEADAQGLISLVTDLEQLEACKLDAMSYLTLKLLRQTLMRFAWHIEAAEMRSFFELADKNSDDFAEVNVDRPIKKADRSVS